MSSFRKFGGATDIAALLLLLLLLFLLLLLLLLSLKWLSLLLWIAF